MHYINELRALHALHYISLHDILLHYSTIYIKVPFALHYITIYIAFHCRTLHYITIYITYHLHYITLHHHFHYTTLYCITYHLHDIRTSEKHGCPKHSQSLRSVNSSPQKKSSHIPPMPWTILSSVLRSMVFFWGYG